MQPSRVSLISNYCLWNPQSTPVRVVDYIIINLVNYTYQNHYSYPFINLYLSTNSVRRLERCTIQQNTLYLQCSSWVICFIMIIMLVSNILKIGPLEQLATNMFSILTVETAMSKPSIARLFPHNAVVLSIITT